MPFLKLIILGANCFFLTQRLNWNTFKHRWTSSAKFLKTLFEKGQFLWESELYALFSSISARLRSWNSIYYSTCVLIGTDATSHGGYSYIKDCILILKLINFCIVKKIVVLLQGLGQSGCSIIIQGRQAMLLQRIENNCVY